MSQHVGVLGPMLCDEESAQSSDEQLWLEDGLKDMQHPLQSGEGQKRSFE